MSVSKVTISLVWRRVVCSPKFSSQSCRWTLHSYHKTQKARTEVLPSATVSEQYFITDYGRPERKLPSLHSRKFNPNPKFLGAAEAYFVCHICTIFQISLIQAFIGCLQSVYFIIVTIYEEYFRLYRFLAQMIRHQPNDESFAYVRNSHWTFFVSLLSWVIVRKFK